MGQLTVASLNTRGMPVFGSRLAERYQAIGQFFEASDVDVVNFQEVLTYYHLRHLRMHLPSFRYAVQQPSAVGPAGGLVTMSRRRIDEKIYQRFPLPAARMTAALPRLSRFKAPLKGILATHLAEPDLWIVNTHLLANFDGDWSAKSRYYELHRQQLAALASILDSVGGRLILSGDFNIARDSSLFEGFAASSQLADAFVDCPPTFHQEYLHPGKSSHCIDFLLFSAETIKSENARLIFTDKVPMAGGPEYASDHLGLTVTLTVS
ncbi:endonuclease/exonuclease/phosphatase [Kribbella qitaiheensis]|uniref:Endonuclease/exonuclease/phosphatase n=1 Tax=Kribbella qitaiheensis TaxID=1544730 RepID=A0A7G6WVR3_9ACTN|nr:endonuclease/exonuclease/phosphatase family protein [Kribbella qitaiheensis]QNE18078.1 endonuclease/exonuclease/phosphatase [Kribbella qitaiheensis]